MYVPYSEMDLDKMVENFGRGEREVPLVIGHNCWGGDEKPALGWVSELMRSGDRLLARAKDLKEELKEAVNSRTYPKRSVEIYDNLDGKGVTLSAVAFLGGSQPAVAGMADFQFSAANGLRFFALDNDVPAVESGGAGRSKSESEEHGSDGGNGKNGSDGRGKGMSQGQGEGTSEGGSMAAAVQGVQGTSTIMQGNSDGGGGMAFTAEQFAALQAENLALKESAEKTAQLQADLEKKFVHERVASYCAELVKSKRVTPAVVNGDGSKRVGLAQFMEGLTEEQRVTVKDLLNSILDTAGTALAELDTESAPAEDADTEDTSTTGEFAKKHGLSVDTLRAQMKKSGQS
jgi:hypothetical protein